VRRAIDPSARPTLENLRHTQQAMTGEYLVARVKGTVVGCGMTAVFPGMRDDPMLWADASVVSAHRSQGIGETLLRRVSARGRELGKQGLQLEVRSDDSHSIRFVENRGFREIEREEEVVLDLTALAAPPPVDAPPGVDIVSLTERPDLERGMYEVDREASADIPGLASSHDQTFEEWRSFAIERPSRDLDLTLLALADGEVVGVAYLEKEGFHNLTGVRRAWRGRGVASALKRAQIAGAHARGMKRLVTESQHENLPMRRLNEKLGYRPTIASIVYQGPLLQGVGTD
jgi:ribosomal protein S18 acetylase RimI-like enzyme